MLSKKNSAAELADLLPVLNTEIKWIFDNEDIFLGEFAKGEYMDLVSVSFTSYYIKMAYILEDGAHIGYDVSINDYMAWRSRFDEHNKQQGVNDG